uniref:Uncharacterized protein n=1 Tax=Meloidogyne incognita TaxID=6306 RepID=A0A914M8V3_MELIC
MNNDLDNINNELAIVGAENNEINENLKLTYLVVRSYTAQEIYKGRRIEPLFNEVESGGSVMGASNRQHIHTPNTWGKLIMDGQAGMDKVIRKLLADKQYTLNDTNVPFFKPAYVILTTHDGRQVPIGECGILDQRIVNYACVGEVVVWSYWLYMENILLVTRKVTNLQQLWN